MSDPLSIIAGIAGVSAAVVQLSNSLYDISTRLSSAPKEIADIASELTSLAAIFDQLKIILDDNRKLVQVQLLDTAQETLIRFDALQKDVTDIVADVGKCDKPWERLKWLFKESRVASLMAKVNAVKASLNLLVSIIQIAVTVSFGIRKSGKKRPKTQMELEVHHRRFAESRAEAVRYTLRELIALSVREQKTPQTQEMLRYRHWKEPTSETISWLYYRTLGSTIQPSCSRSLGRTPGVAKTVATHNADDSASQSEPEDDDFPNDRERRRFSTRISAPVEDAFLVEPGLKSRVVDELLGDWTKMDKKHIRENAALTASSKLFNHQVSFNRTIKATLKQMKSQMDLPLLNGCRIQPCGDIVNDAGAVIGELRKGDPEKLSRIKATCDEQGNVWSGRKRVGKAITVARAGTQGLVKIAQTPPAPEAPAPEAVPPAPYVDAVSDSEGKGSVTFDHNIPQPEGENFEKQDGRGQEVEEMTGLPRDPDLQTKNRLPTNLFGQHLSAPQTNMADSRYHNNSADANKFPEASKSSGLSGSTVIDDIGNFLKPGLDSEFPQHSKPGSTNNDSAPSQRKEGKDEKDGMSKSRSLDDWYSDEDDAPQSIEEDTLLSLEPVAGVGKNISVPETAETVDPSSVAPSFLGLKGLSVLADGSVEDFTGNVVVQLVEDFEIATKTVANGKGAIEETGDEQRKAGHDPGESHRTNDSPWSSAATAGNGEDTVDMATSMEPLKVSAINASNYREAELPGGKKSVSFRRQPLSARKVHASSRNPAPSVSMRSVSTYSGIDQVIHGPDSGQVSAEQTGTSSQSDSERSSEDGSQHKDKVQAAMFAERENNRLNIEEFGQFSHQHRPYRMHDRSLGSRALNPFDPYYALVPYQSSGVYPPMSSYYGHHYSPHQPISSSYGYQYPSSRSDPERNELTVAPLQAEVRKLQQELAQQETIRVAAKLEEQFESKVKTMEEEFLAKRRAENLEMVQNHIVRQNEEKLKLEKDLLAARESADARARSLADLERRSQAETTQQQQALRLAQEATERVSSMMLEAEKLAASKHEEAIKLKQLEVEQGAKLLAERNKMLAEYQERLDAEIKAKERAEDARKLMEAEMQKSCDAPPQIIPKWAESYFAPVQNTNAAPAQPADDSTSIAKSQDSGSAITDTATQRTELTPQTRSGIVRVDQQDLDSDPSQMVIFPSRMGWKEHEYKTLTKSMLRFRFRPLVEEGAETPCVPSQFYERPGSGGCTLRGTALWHPPGPSLASDVYTSFLRSGWKPSYVRSNEYGQTWFLGRQPVHVILFSIKYIPQAIIDDPFQLDHQYAEQGKLYISKEFVEKDVLDEVGYKHTMMDDWRVSLDPKLTHADIENVVARSFLMRETNLRKRYRDSAAQGDPSTGRIEDLGSNAGSVRNSSASLLSINKPSRFRSFIAKSSSRNSGGS